jgi:hypothetical protein
MTESATELEADVAEFAGFVKTLDGDELVVLLFSMRDLAAAKTKAKQACILNDFRRFYLGRRGKTLA